MVVPMISAETEYRHNSRPLQYTSITPKLDAWGLSRGGSNPLDLQSKRLKEKKRKVKIYSSVDHEVALVECFREEVISSLRYFHWKPHPAAFFYSIFISFTPGHLDKYFMSGIPMM